MYLSAETNLLFDEIENSLQGFMRIISYEKAYLDRLVNDKNVNEKQVSRQTEKVNKLFLYYTQIYNAIEPLQIEMSKQYDYGKRIGFELAESKYKNEGRPNRLYNEENREDFRAAHANYIKKIYNHLF